jgi:hypothetical protein
VKLSSKVERSLVAAVSAAVIVCVCVCVCVCLSVSVCARARVEELRYSHANPGIVKAVHAIKRSHEHDPRRQIASWYALLGSPAVVRAGG